MLLYRTIRETVSGTDQPYYETISGVSATAEAILLDTDAAYGGGTGLAMVYALDSGIVYYTQATAQSAQLEGSLGTLLLDASGHVMGFLPEDGGWEDVYIDSATASTLTAVGGSGYRISSGAVVISGGETYDYTTSGYLVLDGLAGSTVRLYRDDDGAVICLYVSGGTATTSEAAVAETTSANSSLSRALGIAGQSYSITKNGAAAEAADLAQYDVGYYDAATNTLRASDYRVSGYLTAASPSVTAAETLTVAGCTFDVLECAWETLGEFRSGDRVTLLLTDDGKVAAVYPYSEVKAEMLGVLAQDGRSVTLSGSGATLTAVLADGHRLTLYCDGDAQEDAQVRILVAQ